MSAASVRLRAGLVLAALALLTGCVGMPTEGPVEESEVDAGVDAGPGIFYDPLPPQAGQTPTEIVSGFLEAMQETPVRTSVALQFLTSEAQEAWEPEKRILTYAELDAPTGEAAVSVDLADVNLYDERGGWVRADPGLELDFALATEDGEWRIDEAPDALVVPDTWFDDWYQRVSLYYFDPTAEILVPEPVFVPEGEQFASALVRGLLTRPTGPSSRVIRTFFPAGTEPGLSVPIKSGVADVSLDGDPAAVDQDSADRMLVQLVWTLRQDPRVGAVELRIGDRAFGTAGGRTQVNLDVGAAYDPTRVGATSDLFALQDGLLVRGSVGSLRETSGPLGQVDLGARAFAASLGGTMVAAVTDGGTALVLAPVDEPDGEVAEVVRGAVDLLAPAWDHRDRTWVVDRAGGRAQVLLVADGVSSEVAVSGMTGRDVTRLLVSRDGTRLVAVVRGRRGDEVVAARVQQDADGRVVGVLRARTLALPDDRRGRIRDLAWRTPTTVSVLSAVSDDLSEVRTISVDGAPGVIATEGSTRSRGPTTSLVSSPGEAPVYAVSGRSVSDLGTPERQLTDLPRGLTGLAYAG